MPGKKLDHGNARPERGTVVLETSGRLQLKVTRKSHFYLARPREPGFFLTPTPPSLGLSSLGVAKQLGQTFLQRLLNVMHLLYHKALRPSSSQAESDNETSLTHKFHREFPPGIAPRKNLISLPHSFSLRRALTTLILDPRNVAERFLRVTWSGVQPLSVFSRSRFQLRGGCQPFEICFQFGNGRGKNHCG